jgi:hypothetical protein
MQYCLSTEINGMEIPRYYVADAADAITGVSFEQCRNRIATVKDITEVTWKAMIVVN